MDTSKIIKNDVDEFGQPRLIERKSRGKMFFVSNPLFKGSELNSRGEKTHMVYVKNGIRSVYPDRTYRKSDTLVSSCRVLVRIADLFDKQYKITCILQSTISWQSSVCATVITDHLFILAKIFGTG